MEIRVLGKPFLKVTASGTAVCARPEKGRMLWISATLGLWLYVLQLWMVSALTLLLCQVVVVSLISVKISPGLTARMPAT